jgi:hypothetical protein
MVIQSQKQFWDCLDINLINTLVDLFYTDEITLAPSRISKYIEEKGEIQKIDKTFSISSQVYDIYTSMPSLILLIKQNNKDLLHLSIHLCPTSFNPKKTGPIHIRKNQIINKLSLKRKNFQYALLTVQQPVGKPNSLVFSIGDGYSSAHIPGASIYNTPIQKVMDVIIDILNNLFNEEHEDYIGHIIELPHPYTNPILHTINTTAKEVSRKNTGKVYSSNNFKTFYLSPRKPKNKTRKIKK